MLRLINKFILPLRLIIPQPYVDKIPYLITLKEQRIRAVLDNIPTNSRVVDIGCGTNELCESHRSRGGSCIGVDVYDWGNVDYMVQDSSELKFEDKEFDFATFVASLNHIPNRVDVLREMDRILTDDGIVVITMLNPILSKIWHKVAYWDKDQNERGMEEGEVYGFTDQQMRDIFQKTSFEIINKKHIEWGLNKIYIAEK